MRIRIDEPYFPFESEMEAVERFGRLNLHLVVMRVVVEATGGAVFDVREKWLSDLCTSITPSQRKGTN